MRRRPPIRSCRSLARAGVLATALLAAGCAPPQASSPSAGAYDEDIAAARNACAAVPAGPERERCIEVQLRRIRGGRNTY